MNIITAPIKNLLKEVITPDIFVVLVTILPKKELRLKNKADINTKTTPISIPPDIILSVFNILSHIKKFC